jgi:hypothetical protein
VQVDGAADRPAQRRLPHDELVVQFEPGGAGVQVGDDGDFAGLTGDRKRRSGGVRGAAQR